MSQPQGCKLSTLGRVQEGFQSVITSSTTERIGRVFRSSELCTGCAISVRLFVQKNEDIDFSDIPPITEWSGTEIGTFYRKPRNRISLSKTRNLWTVAALKSLNSSTIGALSHQSVFICGEISEITVISVHQRQRSAVSGLPISA